jgi:hypothetical protein
LSTLAAEAQTEIERVRQVKTAVVDRAGARLRDRTGCLLPADERAALAFAAKTKILLACERYERRAIARRKRALRALTRLQRKKAKEDYERVGPPRPQPPRTRGNPFREPVLRLDQGILMKGLPEPWDETFACTYRGPPTRSRLRRTGQSTAIVAFYTCTFAFAERQSIKHLGSPAPRCASGASDGP